MAASGQDLSALSDAVAKAITVKAWADRDGSVVVVAANTANDEGPTTTVTFTTLVSRTTSPSPQDGTRTRDINAGIGPTSCTVASMFENRLVAKGLTPTAGGTLTFSDSLRGFATAAYRVECTDTDTTSGTTAAKLATFCRQRPVHSSAQMIKCTYKCHKR